MGEPVDVRYQVSLGHFRQTRALGCYLGKIEDLFRDIERRETRSPTTGYGEPVECWFLSPADERNRRGLAR
jgi:hypothetical protein